MLPFEFTENSVSIWLKSISQLNTMEKGNKLNQILNQLRDVHEEKQRLLPVLLKLTTPVIHCSTSLCCKQLEISDREKNQKIIKLSKLLLRNTALLFHAITFNKSLAPDQKQQCIFFFLQLTGIHLRLNCQYQEMPNETLWKKTAELYAFAKDNQITNKKTPHNIPEFTPLPTIEDTLKRNLLLSIIIMRSIDSNETAAILKFVDALFNKLALLEGLNKDSYFFWNSRGALPNSITSSQETSRFNIYLDTQQIFSFLQNKTNPTKLSSTLRNQIAMHLSGYKTLIDSQVPSPPIVLNLTSGYKNISDFLIQREKINRIYRASETLEKDHNLTLPIESKPNSASQPLNSAKQPAYKAPESIQVKYYQTQHEKFLILELNSSEILNGNLITLTNNKNTMIPGVIRRVIHKPQQTTQILIEKIYGQLSCHPVESKSENKKPIILINEHTDRPEALLPFHYYSNQSSIWINNRQAKLEKLIEFSNHFAHYKINFTQE